MKIIDVYINVAVIGPVNEILNKILDRIDSSGLYEEANKIYLVVNGNRSLVHFAEREKYVIVEAEPTVDKCEFPSLDLIWDQCQTPEKETKILYLHTKGVSRQDPSNTISDWVEYMLYFNVEMWRERVEELERFDCTGVNLGGSPEDFNFPPETWGYGKAPVHYSGNFWWSKSSHVSKLPKPSQWTPDRNYMRWRVMSEMWICKQPEGKYFEAWRSGVNHYLEKYPRHLYEGKNISK